MAENVFIGSVSPQVIREIVAAIAKEYDLKPIKKDEEYSYALPDVPQDHLEASTDKRDL